MKTFEVRTVGHGEFKEITGEVQAALAQSGLTRGHLIIYVPHTTAGLTINENADPAVRRDMLETLDRLVPWKQDFYRHAEGNSAAHVKASLMGFSVTVLVEAGHLALGQWQGIFLCEFDGPRTRKVFVRAVRD